ncbi:MAG: PAS domain S-box protein [Bacteroidales bacterium]|nr:PAS domain S-box protein [Bacteroidales bacterium]
MKKLKFLYLEKEVHEVDIISKKLKEEGIEFTLKHVNSMKDFEQEINLCNYDIIFSCYSQPPCNCLNALEMTGNICPNIPFIIISKDIGEGLAIEAYKLGATGFVNKNHLSGLVPSITKAMFEARDREQRWQAEDMKNKYDFIINTSKSFFSLIDKNYTYEAINKAFCQAHNLLKEEIIGKSLSEIWGERSFRDVIKPNLKKSFANHEVKYQAWFETPNLGKRCYEVTFYPYKDEHGGVTHTVVDTIDITERKEAEISLIESEEKYRNLVEMAQDGILIIVNGKIIYANPVLSQMSGYEKNDFLGQPFQKFIHPSEVTKITNNYINRMAGKKVPNIYDSKIVMKDGTVADIEINASIINYSGEKGLLIILRDITDRKKTEERNKQYTEDLAILNELNHAVNEGKSLSQLMDILSEKTKEMFKGYGGQVYLLSEDKQYLEPIKFSLTLQIVKSIEKLTGNKLSILKIRLKKDSIYRHILQSGKPKIANTPKEFKQHIEEFAPNKFLKKFITPVYHILDIKHLLSVPLITEDGPIGIFDISKREPFTERDVQRLNSISAQITSVIKRKIDEERVKENERKYRLLFESANDAIFLMKENRFIESNQKTLEMFGCKREDIIGKTPVLFSPERQPDGELSEIKANTKINAAFQGKPERFEWLHTKLDGTPFNAEVSLNAINLKGENYLQAIVRDITGQKKAERQIEQRTEDITLINSLNTFANKGETFDRIFRHFSDKIMRIYSSHLFAISILTQDKKELVVENISMNHKLMKILEKMVDARVMKHHVKLPETGLIMNGIHSGKPMILESKSAINQFIRELSNKESSKKIASQISKLLGLNYIVAFPLVSERKVIGLVIVVRKNKFTEKDIQRLSNLFEQITSIIIRKRVEEEMEKLSTAVEQLAETVVITDTKGNIQYANPAFEKISGYLREDVQGENPRILQSGKHDKNFYKNMWDTISGGNVWSGTLINKRKDGRIFVEKANISPIKDETGKITNYVGVKRDITRESELEAQLIQSQRLETVGTLARGIAHDFNNILGTMQGYNDMAIEEAPENSKLFTYLKSIKMASSRAQDLVNQILTFSQVVKPERKPTSIQNLLKDSLEFLKPSISPGVKIVKKIEEKCKLVSADPSQIQQVILNLLANANQALHNTGGELTIELQMVKFAKDGTKVHSELTEKNYVKLTTRDTGVGMDKKTVERIFEPFFTTKSVGEGSGLGLSVVYGIIKNHNGVITVESEIGKGTAFEVYLPVTE